MKFDHLSTEGELIFQNAIPSRILHDTRDFDYFLELAAFACDCPVTVIHFDGEEKHWVDVKNKSLHSLLKAKEFSFCNYVMGQDELVVISDARKHKRFATDPMVIGRDRILFYAGIPLRTAKGKLLGCLCVMHSTAGKPFTAAQKTALKTIAHLAASHLEIKLISRLAIEHATAMVDAEKKVTRLALSEQDNEKEFIAGKIQENFAQSLAATNLYLEFAEHSDEQKDHFIQKSRDTISTVINEMRSLCKTILPASLRNPDTIELLRDMITEWEAGHEVDIDFVCEANLQHLTDDTWFSLFQIIQQQLKIVTCLHSPQASIRIIEEEGLSLFFTMNEKQFSDFDEQVERSMNLIYTRLTTVSGAMSIKKHSSGDILWIGIPAATGKAAEDKWEKASFA